MAHVISQGSTLELDIWSEILPQHPLGLIYWAMDWLRALLPMRITFLTIIYNGQKECL